MGVPTLREIFEEKYYTDLAGGILESFGRLFKNDLKLYAYPLLDAETGALVTAGNLRVAPNLQHLYDYLIENRHIQPIRDYNAGIPEHLLARRLPPDARGRPHLGPRGPARRGAADLPAPPAGLRPRQDEGGRQGTVRPSRPRPRGEVVVCRPGPRGR